MKIAYCVQRYGVEVLGAGAEHACRMIAERLAARPGWTVEVFTTCALDAVTWADELPPGTSDANGVTVHRFRSVAGRDPGFETFSARVLPDPERQQRADQERWIDLQGPVCPAAVDAAADSDADIIAFYPYLYWPTVRGIVHRAIAHRSVMHPAAHDEPPIRMPIFDDVFGAARGLVFQTDGERRLVEHLFPHVAATPQILLGLGVDEHPGTSLPVDAPYLLYVGRVDDGKGTLLLARFFAAYKRRHPESPLRLVLMGRVVHDPPPHPDIIVTGAVDEETKWGALRGAVALAHLSPNEAFSIALVEAWSARVPVLVNARCAATAEHARRSGGGIPIDGYATFETALDRLMADERARASLAAAGHTYVDANFRWPGIIDRYATFLQRVASRRVGTS